MQPPNDGNTPPPTDSNTPPPNDGNTPSPTDGSTPPPNDGNTQPPGDDNTPPPNDSNMPPPSDGNPPLTNNDNAQCSTYNPTSVPHVNVPCVDVAGTLYSVGMNLTDGPGLRFEVDMNLLTPINTSANEECGTFPYNTPDHLRLNCVDLGDSTVWAELTLVPSETTVAFDLVDYGDIPKQDSETGNSSNVAGAYPIVDTNQTILFGSNSSTTFSTLQSGQDFFGQDANYLGNEPSYTDNGDGTITDNVTGLMWQQDPDRNGDGNIDSQDTLSFADAKAGADDFRLAGYSDWRLPTIKELYSLIDFSGSTGTADPSSTSVPSDAVPYLDTEYFKFAYGDTANGRRYIDAQYWSNTEYVSTTMAGVSSATGNPTAFGVNFADGRIKGYGSDYRVVNDARFVRYVRGSDKYGLNLFNDNGDGTISDSATGLMWMQNDSGQFNVGSQGNGSLNWQEALAWCEGLSYAGYDDWRLPNAKELQSLVDYSRSPDTTNSAAIDPLFNVTAITDEASNLNYPFYWSGTTHRDGPDFAVYIAFGEALGCMAPAGSSTLVVTDVHGAGAQRSDPKTANNTALGCSNGPQGDIIRVYNYARCVRGGTATINTQGATANFPTNTGTGDTTTPPTEAIAACSRLNQGDSCTVQTPQGNITGTCGMAPDSSLACIPDGGK
jgi:hypothetical protein